MLNPKITKKIIKKLVISTPGIEDNIHDHDIEIVEDKNINIKVNVYVNDSIINIFEAMKMLQKQIYFELEDKTDLKNYIIDIVIKD